MFEANIAEFKLHNTIQSLHKASPETFAFVLCNGTSNSIFWNISKTLVYNSDTLFLSIYMVSIDFIVRKMLEKCIVCNINVYGLRSLSFESSSVLFSKPTYTSSMQELVMPGMQQKFQKSCFVCDANKHLACRI